MNLTSTQIKDTYGNLVTIGSVAGTPTTGTLQNGAGSDITSLTLNGGAVFNEGGGNFDFRVEGDTDQNLLFVDASTDRIGVGTASPSEKLDVVGNIQTTVSGGDAIVWAKNGTVNTYLVANTTGGLYGFVGTSTNHDFVIRTNNIDKMRIDSSGNVGIGVTPSGQSKFEVYTGAGAFNGVQVQYNATAVPISFAADNSNGDGYIGGNTVQVSGSSGQTYAISNYATKLRMHGGAFTFYTAGYGTAGNAISFSEKVKIDSDGLKFNGDTAAANALDDYEEGTFTPTLLSGSCTGTAYYTKIGRMVNIFGTITHATDGSGVTGITITNIPFTSSQRAYGHAAFSSGLLDVGDTQGSAAAIQSSTQVIFEGSPGGGGMDASRWTSGASLSFNIIYITS